MKSDKEKHMCMISFRLRKEENDVLTKMVRDCRLIGVKSPSQYARKVTLDWIRGKLAPVASAPVAH